MIRRPPRSTPFPTRRSSDLERTRVIDRGDVILVRLIKRRAVLREDQIFKNLLAFGDARRSEEHTSELQSRLHIVCRLLLEKKKTTPHTANTAAPCTNDCAAL